MSTSLLASSEQLTVGIVANDPGATRDLILGAIERSGASAELWSEATALSRAPAVDAIVFDLGAAPERALALAISLDLEPRTRSLPRIFVVDASVLAARIAVFGIGAIVLSDAPPEAFGAAVGRALDDARARSEVLRRAQTNGADLRALVQTMAVVERDGVTLAHDARVLFGVILGFAANLRDGFAGPVSEQQRQHAVNIVEASNDAASLLERYLGVLRRSMPKTDPSQLALPRVSARREVDLGALACDTVALFDGIATAKQIQLDVEVARPVHSWCDAMQIKQALVNLISNALKFTPPGGTVTVIARIGEPASARGGATSRRNAELVVTDTGPGIPEGERARVFERGTRLERDLAVPGTGQGLSIVREIVDRHGGTVRVDDHPGGGVSFALAIPPDRRGRTGEPPPMNSTPAPPHVYAVESLLGGPTKGPA